MGARRCPLGPKRALACCVYADLVVFPAQAATLILLDSLRSEYILRFLLCGRVTDVRFGSFATATFRTGAD